MPTQTTLALIKPGAVFHGFATDIIATYRAAGLTITAVRTLILSESTAQQLYHEHSHKPDFADIYTKACTYPVIALKLRGTNAIARVRKLHGPSQHKGIQPGTIRDRFRIPDASKHQGSVHSADSPEAAVREIALFFTEKD